MSSSSTTKSFGSGGTGENKKEVRCQKCLQLGHWTYECQGKRKYVNQTSRSQRLRESEEDKDKMPSGSSKGKVVSEEKVSSTMITSSDSETSDSESDSSSSSSSTTASSTSSASANSSSPDSTQKKKLKKS